MEPCVSANLTGQLACNLQRLKERMARAAHRAGRRVEDIVPVAVTKSVDASVAQALVDLGVRDLGESRPQELWRKAALVQGPVRWHQIGHLQRNKVRRTLPLIYQLHSLDSLRLAERIQQEADALDLTVSVFVEVNVSGEPTKGGFSPEEVAGVLDVLGRLPRLRVVGLMTMAPWTPEPSQTRPVFAALRELRDKLRDGLAPNCPLTELSMGMSNDFEIAIEEGATVIRVGTALFEGIQTS
jgi:pyridoxal phosphate enzyme (YggS family)